MKYFLFGFCCVVCIAGCSSQHSSMNENKSTLQEGNIQKIEISQKEIDAITDEFDLLNNSKQLDNLELLEVVENEEYQVVEIAEYPYIDTITDVSGKVDKIDNSDGSVEFTVQIRNKNGSILSFPGYMGAGGNDQTYRLVGHLGKITDTSDIRRNYNKTVYPIHYNSDNGIVSFDTDVSYNQVNIERASLLTLLLVCDSCKGPRYNGYAGEYSIIDTKEVSLLSHIKKYESRVDERNMAERDGENLTFDEILEDGTLNFRKYAYAARNDNERWTLSESGKTIQGFFSPSLTIDPTDEFLNPWQSALFECGEDCDIDAINDQYAITPTKVCEWEDGAYRYPLALLWEGSEREVMGYSIHKEGNILTYPVLVHPGDWNTIDFDERYIYEYNCEKLTAKEIGKIDFNGFLAKGFTILLATDTKVYLSLYDEECIYGCDNITQIIEYDKEKNAHEVLNIFDFEGSGRWIKVNHQKKYVDAILNKYYSKTTLSGRVGEVKFNLTEQQSGRVSGWLKVMTIQPNSQGIYLQSSVGPDVDITNRRVYPRTF